jgi:hypothetical protein
LVFKAHLTLLPRPIAARDAAWFEAVDRKTVPSLD